MNDPALTVAQASGALAEAGLSDLVWGHLSVRDSRRRGAWMKAAGWGLDEVRQDRVLLVGWDGTIVDGQGKRHLEYPIHTEIMAAREDVGCVVHTHNPAVNAFASNDRDLHAISHDAVPFTYPQLPRFSGTGALIATAELGRSLADDLGDATAILMPIHGAVTVGVDAAAVVTYAVLLERACRTELLAVAADGPRQWSDEQETHFKRDQAWNPIQLSAGWDYLVRKSSR